MAERGLFCNVLRDARLGDCTGGLSSKHDEVFIATGNGPWTIEDAERRGVPVLEVITMTGTIANGHQYLKRRGEKRHTMMGGNFAWCSDSRFPSRQPLPIHDRIE